MEHNPQAIAHQYKLYNQAKSGAGWLYIIALFSLISSILALTNYQLNLNIGLGITQLIDFLRFELRLAYPETGILISLAAAGLNFTIIGVFAGLSYLAGKFKGWAFLICLVVYVFDTLIPFLLEDYFGFAFHLLAVVGIFRGYLGLHKLNLVEASESLDMEELDHLASLPTPIGQNFSDIRTNFRWVMYLFGAIIIISVLSLLFLLFIPN